MPFTNPILAGLTLIRQAIRSPDYSAGSAGWSINRDGSAEFNNVTTRGTLEAGSTTVTDTPPSALVAYYGSGISSVIVQSVDATLYGYTAMVTLSGSNYRVSGIVRNEVVSEFTSEEFPASGPNSIGLHHTANLNGLYNSGPSTFDGSATFNGPVSGVIHHTSYSGTTDANGFLTVTHGAPWTPVGGWYITTNPAASFAHPWGIDNFTSTTCRLRIGDVRSTGGGIATTAVQGRLFLVR